jgi:hypothetical protein
MTQKSNNAIPKEQSSSQLLWWFGCLVLVGPIHMAEQLMFGLDTLHELRAIMASYYSHFSNADVGTVILVIAVVTLVQSLLLAVLAGGRGRLSVAGLFGVMGVGESHHFVQTVMYGGYFPGVVTSIAYVWIGVMLLRAVIRDWSYAGQSVNQHIAVA